MLIYQKITYSAAKTVTGFNSFTCDVMQPQAEFSQMLAFSVDHIGVAGGPADSLWMELFGER